jgi:hypothetical protein
MRGNESLREEKEVALARWADRYTSRFDQELTNAWPDLAERLREAVASLSWVELSLGPGKDFQEKRIQPAVESWVERYVQPIIEEADRELRELLPQASEPIKNDARADVPAEGALYLTDVLRGLALPGGVVVGGGTLAVAITTVTTWLIFTTVVVNWPLLIAGLAVAVALSWFGVVSLSGLPKELQERFQKKLLPGIREALVGKGVEHKGERIPSLKDQLVLQVRETAEAARRRLEGKE